MFCFIMKEDTTYYENSFFDDRTDRAFSACRRLFRRLAAVSYTHLTLLNFIAGMVLCVVITLSLWFAVFKNRQECRYLLNKLMLKMAKK